MSGAKEFEDIFETQKQATFHCSGRGEEQGRRDECEARPGHGHGPGEDVSWCPVLVRAALRPHPRTWHRHLLLSRVSRIGSLTPPVLGVVRRCLAGLVRW